MVAIVGLECLETEWNLMVLEARNVRLLEVVKLLMKPAFCTSGYCSQYSTGCSLSPGYDAQQNGLSNSEWLDGDPC